ncbi:peptidoglycan-binding protein [Microbacterium sp. M1A1_1b]
MAARRTAIAGGCLVVVLGAGVGTWAVLDPAASRADTTSAPRHHPTAAVERGDLVDTKTFAGSLGYGAPSSVPGAATGTLTWLPAPGQVIHQDEPLYAVDEHPVRAMHGTTPMWRTLAPGARGADVQQLNQDLAALGYDVAVDDVFGRRTTAAVKRWQHDRRMPVTGVVTADDIAFVPGDVRVDAVTGVLGQPAGGDVLRVTSTARVVRATVAQREAERLAVGTAVRVRVNGTGAAMDGTVVDAVPTTGKDGTASVDVTVGFDPGDRTLPAAASAQVEAQGQRETDVLTVPVAALVAGAGSGGGYAVEVVRHDGTTKRVPVQAGFVASGKVAVTGALHAGDRVVVPS